MSVKRANGDSDDSNQVKKQASSIMPVFYNVDEWIEENKKFFLPPVCNKIMHGDGQMKCFFIGGPNQRKDYHIEEGEELFYMLKGDMCLKVVEKGVHKDIPIKEGEIFLLPSKIQHSPQRQEGTVGLVVERERLKPERDGLRYFVEEDGKKTLQSLYEAWFYCTDLGTELVPIIKAYFASEQHKTGKPIPGTIPENPPVIPDPDRELMKPFLLKDWMENNKVEIDSKGKKSLFGDGYQFQVDIYGKGENAGKCDVAEIWMWQQVGECTVTAGGKEYLLKENDSILIPQGTSYTAKGSAGSRSLVCYQDPTRKM